MDSAQCEPKKFPFFRFAQSFSFRPRVFHGRILFLLCTSTNEGESWLKSLHPERFFFIERTSHANPAPEHDYVIDDLVILFSFILNVVKLSVMLHFPLSIHTSFSSWINHGLPLIPFLAGTSEKKKNPRCPEVSVGVGNKPWSDCLHFWCFIAGTLLKIP